MSTRSLICMQIDDDKYKTIYCHSDGYLTYNGAMLLDHYSNKEKLEKLLNLGDISCLNEKVDPDPTLPPHSFDYDKRQEGVVVAYGRDRGETGIEAKMFTLKDLKDKDSWIEYVYIFDRNGKWKYMEYPFDKIRDVKRSLAQEFKKMGIKRPPNQYGFFTSDEIARIKKMQNQDVM